MQCTMQCAIRANPWTAQLIVQGKRANRGLAPCAFTYTTCFFKALKTNRTFQTRALP